MYRIIKILAVVTTLAFIAPFSAFACEGCGMLDICKKECPSAKTEDEAHKCMEGVAVKKKNDKIFRKSDCFAAYREHEKHEKEEGHKH